MIAENLGVSRSVVVNLLNRPDWTDVNVMWQEEVAGGVDDAKICIRQAIAQRLDLGVASMNARWYLSKIEKEIFGDQSKTIVEGGDKAINITNLNIDVSTLPLPLEVKRQILEAIEKKDEEQRQRQLTNGVPEMIEQEPSHEDTDG